MDAFNRRDIDTFIQPTTADFEWFPALGMAGEGGSFRGREGVETYFEALHATWGEVRLVADEVRGLSESVIYKLESGFAAVCGCSVLWLCDAVFAGLSRRPVCGCLRVLGCPEVAPTGVRDTCPEMLEESTTPDLVERTLGGRITRTQMARLLELEGPVGEG